MSRPDPREGLVGNIDRKGTPNYGDHETRWSDVRRAWFNFGWVRGTVDPRATFLENDKIRTSIVPDTGELQTKRGFLDPRSPYASFQGDGRPLPLLDDRFPW